MHYYDEIMRFLIQGRGTGHRYIQGYYSNESIINILSIVKQILQTLFKQVIIIMKNSSENSDEKHQSSANKQYLNKFLELSYQMSVDHAYSKQIHSLVTFFSIILTLLIYLSLPEIGIIDKHLIILDPIPGLCLMLANLAIVVQIVVGVIKGVGIDLKIQSYVYLNVVFLLGSLSILHEALQGTFISSPVALLVFCLSLIITLALGILFGSESYSNILIDTEPFPICVYMMPFSIFLYIYSLQQDLLENPLLLMLGLISTIIRFSVFDGYTRKSKQFQYYLLRMSASFNFFYSINLLFLKIFSITSEEMGFAYIFCTMALLALYQMFDLYIDQMPTLPPNFFKKDNCFQSYKELGKYCQYVASEIYQILDINHQGIQFSDTCLGAVYYEHIKNCQNIGCEISNEINLSDFKHFQSRKQIPYKNLCQKVCRIMEMKFEVLLAEEPQNIELKMILIKFYAITNFNKFKIFKLLTEIEVLKPSLRQKIELYRVKRLVAELDVIEALENIKIDNSLHFFSKNLKNLLSMIIDFWTLMMDEKVDFSKVVKTSEKIFPLMQTLEENFNDAVHIETYSSVKIMRVYAEFSQWIINDSNKTIMVNDYIELLSKKLEEISEINYISSDSEKALIAISLNAKCLGNISMVNSQTCNLFGYEKEEMQNFNINNFMPKIFGKNHNDFLQAFMKNPNKKVNTDVRDIFAKNKLGYIFPIYLQLKKSLTTVGDDFMFITAMETARSFQTPIAVICDEQGIIVDYSSTFEYLFIKSLQKRGNGCQTITNIQQIIPDFYSMYEHRENEAKKFSQVFDNPVYGILQIDFEISKLSFPKEKDAGYVVKGFRFKQEPKILFSHLNLTHSLIQLDNKKQLEGHSMSYISKKNYFALSSEVHKFVSQAAKSYFTIPFIKIEEITGALFGNNIKKNDEKDFETDIKTIRLCVDHYERVQDPDSFITESETEHYHLRNNKKLSELRQQFGAPNKKQNVFKKYSCLNNILSVFILTFLVVIYAQRIANNLVQINNLSRVKSANQFRELLSEYVVYLQIEEKGGPTDYTTKYKAQIIESMIQMNLKADIPQEQKETAMKIMYLESDEKVDQMLQNDTFYLPNLIEDTTIAFLLFKICFCILVLAKMFVNIILIVTYRVRLREIYNFFLALPEFQIKKSMENCKFVLNNMSHQNSLKKEENMYGGYEQDNENEDQHIKIRKFKNITLGNEKLYYLKIGFTSLVIIVFFGLVSIYGMGQQQKMQNQMQSYIFMSTVTPESSVYLMKKYLQVDKNSDFEISEEFQSKIQNIELQSMKLMKSVEINYFQWLLQNPCKTLLKNESPHCETLLNGVLTDGVSKGLNYMINRLPNIEKSADATSILLEFTELLYQNIKTIFNTTNKNLHQELLNRIRTSQTEILIFLLIILVLMILDIIFVRYGQHITLNKRLQSAQNLLRIIPPSFNQNKLKKDGYEPISS